MPISPESFGSALAQHNSLFRLGTTLGGDTHHLRHLEVHVPRTLAPRLGFVSDEPPSGHGPQVNSAGLIESPPRSLPTTFS